MSAATHVDAEAAADLPPAPDMAEEPEDRRVGRLDLARILLVIAAALAVGLASAVSTQLLVAMAAVVLFVGAWPVLHEAVSNLLERRMTMELSMTIAIIAALVVGEVFVALVIAAFVLVAELLEGLAVARGRHAIRDLLEYLPPTAIVRRDDRTEEVRYGELRIGDVVLVNPGASVPVDGTVLRGLSHVDEATITGEPAPAAKRPGDGVYAGTVNQLGALEVRAERIGRDSAFGRIVEAVERAEHARAPVQRRADRLAGYLVAFALLSSAATFVLTRDVTATISVIIVAGACGVAAGTPLAILGAIGRAARQGAMIKGGRHVETLWAVDTVVLDKTGTLTLGKPVVQQVFTVDGVTVEEVLAMAATAEVRSEHPLGRAIIEHARENGIEGYEPDAFASVPGKGVRATQGGRELVVGSRSFVSEWGADMSGLPKVTLAVASEVVIAVDGRATGAILIADRLRDRSGEAVAALRRMGIRTVLLSGDQPDAVAVVAGWLGVDEHIGGLLPEDKRERVRQLVAAGRTVAMVGDGINDAPALLAASVGVAMGSGTDVTRESADVVLIGNDLSRFVETLRLSRRTDTIINQNVVGTIGIDLVGVLLAAFGILGPLMAVIIHVGSELAFILNSARLVPPPRALHRGRTGTE